MKSYKTIIILCFLSLGLQSQDLISHFNNDLPQATLTRVSYYPTFDYSGGIPFITYDKISITTSNSLNDLIYEKKDSTAYINVNHAINQLKPMSYIYSNNRINIVSSSWLKGDLYFHFNITDRSEIDVRLPKDVFELGWKGNAEFIGKTADLNGMGVDIVHFNEISLSLCQNINDKVFIGTRIKYLQGLSNFSTQKSDIKLTTDSISYDLKGTADILINASGPIDTNGLQTIYSYNDYIFNFQNPGYGFDVGISANITEKFKVSADIIDISRIWWTDQVKNLEVKNTQVNFGGLEIDSIFSFQFQDTMISSFLDSFGKIFKPVRTENNYMSYLAPKIYVSAAYQFNEKNKLGLTYYQRFNRNYNYSSVSLLYSKNFGTWMNTTLKYSLVNGSYSQFGAGVSFRFGRANIFVISEDLVGLFKPISAQQFHLAFGCNFITVLEKKEGNLKID